MVLSMGWINKEYTNNTHSTFDIIQVLFLVPIFLGESALAADMSEGSQGSLQEQSYLYNPGFLVGSEKIDVARFSYGNDIVPGNYSVSILVNQQPVGNTHILIKEVGNKKIICLNKELVSLLNIKTESI
ncbi:FimD/PapC N-terminal domain-containing protein, partial [Yersinia intermedia]|uniref:FimD/PapC N-terminal domain-containing protein n=1 Tax=Yersinia intermedia TaxID=631 RepID=UPI0022FEC905